MVITTPDMGYGTGTSSLNIKFKVAEKFDAYKMEYKDFMETKKSDVLIEQATKYEGPGAPGELFESESFKPTAFIESYLETTDWRRFGYELRLSYKQNKFKGTHTGFQQQIAHYLTRGATYKYDVLGADVLNNAFTDSAAYHGGDSGISWRRQQTSILSVTYF